MSLKIANILPESYVDGPGIRTVIFLQGCIHHCKGCHNPTTWNLNGGRLMNYENIISIIQNNPLVSGVTISGGEPFLQAKNLIELVTRIKKMEKDIWIYSGYTLEELLTIDLQTKDHSIIKLLGLCNVLVDGRYEEDKRDLSLHFRGSQNQRIIHLSNNNVIANHLKRIA